LQSIYGMDYFEPAGEDQDQDQDVDDGCCFHVGVYQIADKHDVPELRKAVIRELEDATTEYFYGEDDSFSPIRKVFSLPAADKSLQNWLMPRISEELVHLMKMEAFRKVLEEVPLFAASLLAEHYQGVTYKTTVRRCHCTTNRDYRCASCKKRDEKGTGGILLAKPRH